MFGKKRQTPYEYDRDKETPVIRASICTGEEVAGFQNKETGQFRDVCLLRNSAEKEAFCRACGIAPGEIRKIY
ncbi:MAG: aspartate dehydrogenase [Lachnospiraceae bacterium]|nr:aspartate dehydrogenase [Lachnospiraceae bacterium]